MTLGEVLAPVAARYASWLGLDAAQVAADVEDDAQVRALQFVLRLERDGTPSRSRALELAATACALLCLDERAAPGGPWHDAVDAYCRGHIRKVTRRARSAGWDGTADLPGLTLTDGDTQVRALVPGLVSELDKRVAKLQVGGTDLPVEEAPEADVSAAAAAITAAPEATPDGGAPRLVCHLPVGRALTAGKLMAQTGHAGMIAAALAAGDDPDLLAAWHDAGCPARVVEVGDDAWNGFRAALADPARAWREDHLLAVRDAGYTEVDPGTVTVIARLA